jgi:hypothetical protein
LLPAIRCCIRGDVLLKLQELLGVKRLEQLRKRPYRCAVSDTELVDVPALEKQLLLQGVRVLITDVDDMTAKALLFEALSSEALLQASDNSVDAVASTPDSLASEIDPAASRIAAELHKAEWDAPIVEVSKPISDPDFSANSPLRTTVRVAASRNN